MSGYGPLLPFAALRRDVVGLVGSLNRPGGNLTGISFLSSTLPAKQFDLLRQLLPQALTIGFLVNPNFPDSGSQSNEMQGAADASGVKLIIAKAESEK